MAKTRKKVTPRQAGSARTLDRMELRLDDLIGATQALVEAARGIIASLERLRDMVRRSERR